MEFVADIGTRLSTIGGRSVTGSSISIDGVTLATVGPYAENLGVPSRAFHLGTGHTFNKLDHGGLAVEIDRHRHAQLCLVTVLLITAKLIDWRDRRCSDSRQIRWFL